MTKPKLMKYKGYRGTVEYSLEDNLLFGKVVGIKGLILYQGETLKELRQDFQTMVDDYLQSCKEQGIEPEKEYKGSFNIRIEPKLHAELEVYSAANHQSLNRTVEQAIEQFLS
ncbi:MAG: type II toxin-antitoxin system HicB family antitoxin [Lactobacillus sp.]|jgi:predicted HicB family RNase H-like nuclease|nr:type II toxin-antitoxin system HicB family antitoxin [Lactobacillus sp.]MCH3904878.1 type II toxin-antitoxin system HicB family antitoxin [Lactobacillus sp.]MCH3905793.1 type II toxin-antitoxin system HicB family antitoxin [Lactobacillus sp.]MCH3990635.1 type II toxin-antitoxin system HicB family antitoxin [Lactobacillus sp.]MCH4068649.1 type II toxin-antitoxin system HicB family antitoxin [Lactobacillus sp.]